MHESVARTVAAKGIAAWMLCGVGAFDAVAGTDANPESRRSIEMSAAGPAEAPVIALPPGRVATIAFLDSGGSPWAATQILAPDTDWLSVHRAPEHAHMVLLEARNESGSANLVALLDGLAAPVHLDLAGDDSATATRVEVRLTDPRPQTVVPTGLREAPAAPDRPAVNAAIRDYLLSHPEVLREALDPARQLASNVASHRAELLSGDGVPLLGDASATVTVVEFFDYRCGFCKRSLEAVRGALDRSGVRLQMREYPILGEDSLRASRLALAAGRQGAYGEAHFALMAHEGAYDEASVEGIATALGLDLARLRADMASPEVEALIEANRELADRLGVTGTPAFLVLGPERVEISPGAVDAERLLALIDAAG